MAPRRRSTCWWAGRADERRRGLRLAPVECPRLGHRDGLPVATRTLVSLLLKTLACDDRRHALMLRLALAFGGQVDSLCRGVAATANGSTHPALGRDGLGVRWWVRRRQEGAAVVAMVRGGAWGEADERRTARQAAGPAVSIVGRALVARATGRGVEKKRVAHRARCRQPSLVVGARGRRRRFGGCPCRMLCAAAVTRSRSC